MPWIGFTGRRVPILAPPGGHTKLDELASAISERAGFFDHTFDVIEYDPSSRLEIGDMSIDFLPGRHYVPAWGCAIHDRSGAFVVVTGDTGPNEAIVEASRGADLFVVEATLLTVGEDDPTRGHLTYQEAIDMGARAGATTTVLVHYRPQNTAAIMEATADRTDAIAGRPGLVLEVGADRSVESHRLAGPGAVAPTGDPQANGDGTADVDVPAGTASRAARAR
jgi:ribonuclease BN (tRNA processing enzyme)